jgi:muramoyltetrapeptide carboxypeptidase
MFARRTLIGSMGAYAAAGVLPLTATHARSPRRPPRLRPGDTVGLVEPAGFSDDQQQVDAVQSAISAMGLRPKVGRYVASRYGYLAGSDQQRAYDLNTMFGDDEVRAIFAVRGGWGSARLLPLLDWKTIRTNPKLLIGSSDITALHLAIAARAGFPTIHAPNAASNWQEISWSSLHSLAFAGATPTFQTKLPQDGQNSVASQRLSFATIRGGQAQGRLLGGNLSVLTALAGSPWLPSFDDAILFLEDIGEAEYRIDRMMSQLALSGILRKVAGVVFGQCTRCTTGVMGYLGFTVPQILEQYLRPLGIPAFYGANIGHVANQLSLPVGARVRIDADLGTIRILEPVVS